MWIATAERTRQIDRLASEEFGVPGKVLMERAGLAIFQAVREMLPDGGHIGVFCGKGNNGGDGFVVARIAKEHGYGVDCLVAALENDLSDTAREQMWVTRAAGIEPIFYDDARFRVRSECVGCRDLVIDALLGTGAESDVHGPLKDAIQAINRSGVPVLSVDVPSGIHCDTGEELGESVWALRTVTFGMPKPYLFQGLGLEHSGHWTVAEIGYPNALLNQPTYAKLIEGEWVGSLLPERLRASHKGDHGSILIVAGSDRMPGAATLAARAAFRSGAGLVTVAGVRRVCDAVAANVPEALVFELPDEDGVIGARAAEAILGEKHRYHAALFGPGLTHGEPVLRALETIWAGWESPCVIDADALNAVSQGVHLPSGDCVMTPHPGEMSRLLKSSIAEIQADRFRTIEQAVAQYQKCVLLKGPFSIIGEPGEPMMVNSTGNPGLASAGMGDVLSGVIVTLLAQDLPPYFAASCGAYWHGLAGDLCSCEIGPVGYTAIDVANELPSARAKILYPCETKAPSYYSPR